MKPISIIIFFAFAIFTANSQEKAFQSDKLQMLWESPKDLQTPESVCFDIANQVLYVSNINGKPTDKDGNGFISLLSVDCKITELKWISGLNAPKGMGIYNGKLYVTDIDRVAVININNKSIEQFFEFPEAKFLNDIAIDKSGAVYISDMMSNRIYRIFENKPELWLDDKNLTDPNGLFIDKDKLFVGCNKIVEISLNDKNIHSWLENTGGIDGLKGLGNGRFIFSDWTGSVYLVNEDREIEKLLDISTIGLNAADIEILPEKNIFYVPTFNGNKVIAYQLK